MAGRRPLPLHGTLSFPGDGRGNGGVRVLTWKQAVRSRIRKLGIDVRRAEPTIIDFIRSRDITVVYDVGANTGQYGEYLRHSGYEGRIVSFEPVRSVYEELTRRIGDDPGWEAHNCGLGAAAATATITVARSTVFSSLLPVREAAAQFDTDVTPARQEEIAVATLDSFAAGRAGQRGFLKMDTQGFEQQVLAGARDTLPGLAGIQMELPVIHLYEGVWTMTEAIGFMSGSGFVLSQATAVNYHSKDPCAVVEFDCVFRRLSAIDG